MTLGGRPGNHLGRGGGQESKQLKEQVYGACCNLLRTGFGESVLVDGNSQKKKTTNTYY